MVARRNWADCHHPGIVAHQAILAIAHPSERPVLRHRRNDYRERIAQGGESRPPNRAGPEDGGSRFVARRGVFDHLNSIIRRLQLWAFFRSGRSLPDLANDPDIVKALGPHEAQKIAAEVVTNSPLEEAWTPYIGKGEPR